jgi:O-antigen/teichoic acid export membrane protein
MLLNNRSFASSVLTMLSGSAFALAIPFLASPVLARIYSPDMFGQLGVFVAAISIGAIVATGRYELAIVIPKNQGTALGLTVIALILALIVSSFAALCLALIAWIKPEYLGKTLPTSVWTMAVPVGIFLLAAIQAFSYWHSRRHAYGLVARARASQAIIMTGCQLLTGFLSASSFGLMISLLIGALTSLLQLACTGLRELQTGLQRLTRHRVLATAKRYSDMPKYLVVGHLANVVSTQLPVIMLAALYSPYHAGLYAFAERLTLIPCGVVANSVGEVFRQSAAQLYRKQGSCIDLFLQTKRRLVALAIVFAITVVALIQYVFPSMLGKAWQEIGQLAISLGILAFFQTISSPLSQTVLLAAMYREDLTWQILRLGLSMFAIYLGYVLHMDFTVSVFFHSLAFAIAYILHSCMQYVAARGNVHHKMSI